MLTTIKFRSETSIPLLFCLFFLMISVTSNIDAQQQTETDEVIARIETLKAIQKANDHYYEKRYAEAVKAYQTLLKGKLTESQKGSMLLMLGQSHVRLNEDKEAKRILSELINDNPNGSYATQAVHTLTGLYRTRYQISEAVLLCKQLMKQHPDTAVAAIAAYLTAYFQYVDGKYDDAIVSYKSFLKNYPDSVYRSSAISSLVRLYTTNKRFTDAEELITEQLKLNPSDTTMLEELATIYQQQGKQQKALKLYKDVLEKNPTNSSIRQKLGSLYIELGDKEKAIAEWNKLATDGLDRFQQLGSIYLTHKMYDEAIVAFQKAIQANPSYGYLYSQLASAYKIQGNVEKAATTYLEGLRQIGSSVSQRAPIWEAMLEIYEGESQKPLREKLIAQYQNELNASPRNIHTAIILGELYFYAGQFQETLKLYKQIHRTYTTYVDASLQRLANVLERNTNPSAIDYYETLLLLSKDTRTLTNTRYSLSRLYQKEEAWNKAASILMELNKNDSSSIESQFLLAKIQLYGLHDPKAAQITLQSLLSKRLVHNQYNEARLILGEVHTVMGRFTLARQVLSPIVSSASSMNASARKLIGDSYFYATDFDNALTEYRKVILSSKSDKLTNDALERIVLIQDNSDYLGLPLTDYIHALQHYLRGNIETAITQCEDTISIHNKALIVDDIWMLLGLIHSSQKAYGAAIHSYRQVITLESPLAAEAMTQIAEIYQKKNDFASALETYTTLLTTYPDNSIVPHVRQQLDNVTKLIKNTDTKTP